MKIRPIAFLVLLLPICVSAWAQEIEKEYYRYATEYVNHCEDGNTYVWRERNLYSSGTYHDTVFTTTPIDSIYTIKFTLTVKYERNVFFTIAPGDSLTYRGVTYRGATRQDITIPGDLACDTIEHLNITISAHIDRYASDYFCKDTLISWRGQWIYRTGEYLSHSATGDTTYHYTVTISATPPTTHDTIRRCTAGDPFMWHGQRITQPGTYTAILPSTKPDGCDTTANLNFIVYDAIPPTRVNVNVCGSTPYFIHGKEYYGNNTFTDVFHSQYGCDSVVVTTYTTQQGTYFFRNDSINFREQTKYYWEEAGKWYTRSGETKDIRPSRIEGGCDTLYYLYLAPVTHTYISACEGEKLTYEGQLVTSDTIFKKISYTPKGWMDKVEYFHYEFDPVIIAHYDTVWLCHNEKYRWYYNDEDTRKYLDISERTHNISQTKFTEIIQQRGTDKCERSSIVVRVRPYTVKQITPRIVRALDTCMIKDYYWVVRPGDTIVVHQTRDEKRTYTDTIRSVVTGCDSLYTQREFVCTSHCSEVEDWYLYKDTIYILGQPYSQLGQYQVPISLGNIDSIYNFRIVPYTPPTPRDSLATGCYLNLPLVIRDKYQYFSSQLDTLHSGYRRQPECDSAILALDVRIAERMHDTIYTGFCANDSFLLPVLHKVIHEQGIYFDTLRDDTGCDSIIPYHLTKWPNPTHITTKYLWPDSLPYIWTFHPKHGEPEQKELRLPGDYQSTFVLSSGCDSIDILRLLPVNSYYFSDTSVICNNELPFTWRGRDFYTSGDYFDSLTTTCCQQDSVYQLHLVVNDTIVFRQTVALFPYDKYSISWKDLTLEDTASIFSVRLERERTGCDSIYEVKVIPAIITRVTLDTCVGATFKGRIITSDIQFYDTMKTRITHVDSIIHYSVFAHSPATYVDTVNLLHQPGQQYLWHDTLITTPGTYFDYRWSSYGCHDTYILIASACTSSRTVSISHHPCQGYPIFIDSHEYNQDTTVIEQHTTRSGCDSTTIHIIAYRVPIIHRESVFIYPKDTISRGSKIFTRPGVYYYDTVPTFDLLCDSIIYCLNVLKPTILERDTNIYLISLDLPYEHNGQLYCTDQTFTDTIYNSLGKDSLYFHQNYIITEAYSDTIFYDLCQGDTLYVNNLVIYESGYYTAHLRTRTTDKDSLFRCYVRVITPIETSVFLYGCDTIQYSGHTFYYNGSSEPYDVNLYHSSLVTGCDSIEHLHLTIHPTPPIVRLDVTYPDNEVFKYRDREYSRPCQDTIRISMPNSCDTVEYLNIRFYDRFSESFTYYCCRGESIIVSDRPYYPTRDTTLTDTTTDGSTITIKRIRIIVRDPYELHRNPSATDQEVAAGKQVHFQVAYQTTGRGRPDFYDVHFIDNGIEAVPDDSTYTIDAASTASSSIYPILMHYNNDDCIYPGKYKFTITFRSLACVRCNFSDTLSLRVLYPAHVMSSKWNNVVMLSPNYIDTINNNGNCFWDLAAPFEWRINGERIYTDGDPEQAYLYVKSGIQDGSQIQFASARKGHNEIVGSYPYIFHREQARPGSTGSPHNITITPTLAPRRTAVRVQSDSDGDYHLYTPTGQIFRSGTITNGSSDVSMPDAPGCYLLQIILKDNNTHVEKLIVY